MQKILIASDHAGYDLKEFLKKKFLGKLEFNDLGCHSTDSVNYPNYAASLVEKIKNGEFDKGILICGTGIGMSITANRVQGIRASLCHNVKSAEMTREHNDSNVLVLGARMIDENEAEEILNAWLKTNFVGGRHQTRIDLIETLTQ